ncbi:MAG TPA: hypothetical protein VIK71_10405 [Flavobacteriales bacterium]
MKKLIRYIKKHWFLWLLLVIAGFMVWSIRFEIADWVRAKVGGELPVNPRPPGISDLQSCEQNYKSEMTEVALELGLPYEYLMALTVLECGGNKPAGNRFEKHVFNQLKKVRDGQREKYENIRQEHLKGLDDEELKNLATSWGPFQLMGYKVIPLGVNVAHLRNDRTGIPIAAKWIKEEYGHFLERGKWKDAFHFHNTGKRFPLNGKPKTHNPYYVSDGLKHMKYFAKNSPFPMIKEGGKKKE